MKKKFTNAVLYGKEKASEILVADGKILEEGNDLGEAEETIDLGGKLVTAPFVDPHLHLDYVLSLAQMDDAESGTIFGSIELGLKHKETKTV